MRAASEANLPPVMPQGNLVEVLGREVGQGLPGELMVEKCKTTKGMSDEAADVAALTYLLNASHAQAAPPGRGLPWIPGTTPPHRRPARTSVDLKGGGVRWRGVQGLLAPFSQSLS